jgi:2-(1,2-epoxy-1,2-dihydrophenyl)acetyl-CoA isomerase
MMSRSTSDTILFAQQGSIGTLTFNRPAVYNAMNTELIHALRDVTTELVASKTMRALILKGAGNAFLAGGDVGLFYKNRDTIVESVKPLGDALHAGIKNIRNMPFPVIAQIHGACAGAGLSVAMAADFAIAAEGAQFNTAYTKIGLSPDGGSTFFLPRYVGMKRAIELIMLADSIDANTAAAMGIINRVVPADKLEQEVAALAERLSNGATQALARAKKLINQSFVTPIDQQLDDEIAYFAECSTTTDFKEGVTAFVEKRKPRFEGQ